MSRLFFATAFLLGAAAIAWMGLVFIGSNVLGLAVTALIGGVYFVGFMEIVRFRQATSTLTNALAGLSGTAPMAAPDFLEQWLGKLHPSLQNAVRLRIEGERVGLPAPVITPYLVGLLVMLGLFGTFLGMVDTLHGAVAALEGTTELLAIRAGLAAPIKGLGLAFGTSVAGVAASAMLGLIATLSRRDRMFATRQLDGKISTIFREFSLAHLRQQTLKAMQLQANALPEVAERLHALASAMERMGDNLGDKLLANQERFHLSVQGTYSELASSLRQSLAESVTESGRQAIESGRQLGESIKPLLESVVTDIGNETRTTHRQLSATVREQLEGVTGSLLESFEQSSSSWLERQQLLDRERFELWTESFEQAAERSRMQSQALCDTLEKTASEMSDNARANFSATLNEMRSLLQSSEALIQARIEGEASWLQAHGQRMSELTSTLRSELQALRNDEERRGQAALDSLAGLESTVASQLASLAKELEEPIASLIQTASETPRAAAEVIDQLRREMSNSIERDNTLLEERQRIMTELNTVLVSLQHATSGQREAIESLVRSSVSTLEGVGLQFAGHVASEVSRLSTIADDFAVSTIETSSHGDAFGLAVTLFNEANGKLVESLNRIEKSLAKSSKRSDEQLAYYVAQAREIIDHSMLSQKSIFDELRQLGQRVQRAPEPAAKKVL